MQPFVLPKLLLLFVHTGQLSGLLLTSVVCEHTTLSCIRSILTYMEMYVEYMDIPTMNLAEESFHLLY